MDGYLAEGEVPDAFRILPPVPSGNSPTRRADIDTYRETRKLIGSARWALAASDSVHTPVALLADESCALGVRLDQTDAPRLKSLLTRVARDSSEVVDQVKDQFRQERPFAVLPGPICSDPERVNRKNSYGYPSGHATYSWAVGLILAELAPDRAAAILARARAFGESRVVCGVHWVSDVEEGRTTASVLVATLHAKPAFEEDLAAARQEVAAARTRAPHDAGAPADSPECAAEAAAHTPWTR